MHEQERARDRLDKLRQQIHANTSKAADEGYLPCNPASRVSGILVNLFAMRNRVYSVNDRIQLHTVRREATDIAFVCEARDQAIADMSCEQDKVIAHAGLPPARYELVSRLFAPAWMVRLAEIALKHDVMLRASQMLHAGMQGDMDTVRAFIGLYELMEDAA